jgi:hypothetical protein
MELHSMHRDTLMQPQWMILRARREAKTKGREREREGGTERDGDGREGEMHSYV